MVGGSASLAPLHSILHSVAVERTVSDCVLGRDTLLIHVLADTAFHGGKHYACLLHVFTNVLLDDVRFSFDNSICVYSPT